MFRLLSSLALLLIGCGDSTAVTGSVGAAACVTANACGLSTAGVSACTAQVQGINNAQVAAFAHLNGAQVNCLATAGANCDAARRCLNGGMPPATCTGTSVSCVGSVRTLCSAEAGTGGHNATTQFDCASVGEMCVAGAAGTIDCGYGTCAPGAASCVGTKLQYCNGGVIQQIDCGQNAATCVTGTFGVAHCRGTGPACTSNPQDLIAPKAVRCDGAVLVTCADGQEARKDCGQLQEGCFANALGNSFDCALGNQCDPNNVSAMCVGNRLSYCNNGVTAMFDCGAAGFKGCKPDHGGSCTL